MAGFNDTALNLMVGAIKAAGTYISAHTADPSTGGTSEVAGGSYVRVQTTWGSNSSGDTTGSEVSVNIPASTTITYWGIWSASTSGTFYGGFALTAPEAFGSAGVWKHTPTIDVDAV